MTTTRSLNAGIPALCALASICPAGAGAPPAAPGVSVDSTVA